MAEDLKALLLLTGRQVSTPVIRAAEAGPIICPKADLSGHGSVPTFSMIPQRCSPPFVFGLYQKSLGP